MLTRQELLPDALTKELEPLLSDVPPLSFAEMQTVLEEDIPDWRESSTLSTRLPSVRLPWRRSTVDD